MSKRRPVQEAKPEKKRKPRPKKITTGGAKLVHIIKATPGGVSGFARKAGVTRVAIYRAINGERWEHITIDFAIKCSEASGGIIAIVDFASKTGVPVKEDGEEEEPARARKTGTYG